MPKKPGISLEQHETLGLELQIMRDKLTFLVSDLGKAYPREISDIARKAASQIDTLRGELESLVAKENARMDTFRVYRRSNREDYELPARIIQVP